MRRPAIAGMFPEMLGGDFKLTLCKRDDCGPAFVPVLPDGLAPAADHRMARRAGLCDEDVGDVDGRRLLRNRGCDPTLAVLGELHMRPLHLAAGEVLFEVEIQADEAEDNADGLGIGTSLLDRIGVNDVLMDKGRVAKLEGVEGQVII
jgi:hypothetical protein